MVQEDASVCLHSRDCHYNPLPTVNLGILCPEHSGAAAPERVTAVRRVGNLQSLPKSIDFLSCF